MKKLKKKKNHNNKDRTSPIPSVAPDTDGGPECEPETHTERESRKPKVLRVVFGTPIPSRGKFMFILDSRTCSDLCLVFGRNIPYEITIDGPKSEPTRTFSHFQKLPHKYSRPAANEVLHVREDDYEYLTLERINGATRIIAGTLQCLTAELAHPLFAKHGRSWDFTWK